MSEQRDSGYFDSEFAALMSGMSSDPGLAKAMDAIEDQHNEQVIDELFAPQTDTTDPRGPYYTKSLDDEAKAMLEGFYQVCQDMQLDLMASTFSPRDIQALYEHMGFEVYALRDTLRFGDTISASSAIVMLEEEDEYGMPVDIYFPANEQLQGTFLRPFIDRVPDDAQALTQEIHGLPPLGIGILLSNPVLIDEHGHRDAERLAGQEVVVVLGTVGLKLTKLYFRSEEVFTTPPDDTSDH